jgi:hypothetical protein
MADQNRQRRTLYFILDVENEILNIVFIIYQNQDFFYTS